MVAVGALAASSCAAARAQESTLAAESARAQALGRHVLLAGAIPYPGAYGLRPGESLMDLLKRAGGIKSSDSVALSRVIVWRDDKQLTVNLRDGYPDEVLEGDIVIVPRNNNRVMVTGSIGKPGIQLIPDGGTLSVAQALDSAGGLPPSKDDVKVFVLRQPPGGEVEQVADYVLPRDTDRLNRALENGDVVYVEQKYRGDPACRPWIISPFELLRNLDLIR